MQVIKKGNLTILLKDGVMLQAASYGTCIAVRLADGAYVFNATKYSQTTTRHQNVVAKLVDSQNWITSVFDAHPGIQPHELALLAKHD